ncbi:MAG: hypothetical protein ACJAVR_001630 [Paracoccaceae bacterium]
MSRAALIHVSTAKLRGFNAVARTADRACLRRPAGPEHRVLSH